MRVARANGVKHLVGIIRLSCPGIGRKLEHAVATACTDGNNMPLIRYAEVLLGYLKARLESGAPVNKVRGRVA